MDAQTLNEASGWLPNDFQSMVVVGLWLLAVLLFGIWRSVARADPDPIRPSGPTE